VTGPQADPGQHDAHPVSGWASPRARRAAWYHATVADPDLPAVAQFCLCRRCAERHLLAVVREYVVETEARVSAQYGRPFRFAERAPIAVGVGPGIPAVAA